MVIYSDDYSALNGARCRTGYGSPLEPLKEVFGPQIIEQAGPLWGTDDEGELRGIYRPTGHKGVCTLAFLLKSDAYY